MIRGQLSIVAPAVSKNSLPKNQAVGGMPAKENRESAMIKANAGFEA